MSTRSKFPARKVIVAAMLAVGAVAAILIASSIAQATAQQQQQHKMMMWSGIEMPRINGSISTPNEPTATIIENVKMPFVTAAVTAQDQVANGTVLGGHLGVVQGYLVYKFFVADTANQTGYLTVIDAGNGKLLYTSEALPPGSFDSLMYGHWEGHERGGWHGAGKWHGFAGGTWR
jgi:uncharacterized membrane protein YkoI